MIQHRVLVLFVFACAALLCGFGQSRARTIAGYLARFR